eukprot:jgi/Chrzof1/186/Cz01g06100.t1
MSCLKVLNLSGCGGLQLLPESMCQLAGLEQLDLSSCSSQEQLPVFMSSLSALRVLNLSFCNSLSSLPEHMPLNLQVLDLSYCRHMHGLAQSLVHVSEKMHTVGVVLQGWGALVPVPGGSHEQPVVLKDIASHLRQVAVIQRLLTDKDSVLTSLERLSWLAVMLAAATFTGAIAPPGGYNDGLLFLPYNNNDRSSSNGSSSSSGGSSIPSYSSINNCTIASTSNAMCPIGADDIRGCISTPDTCTDGVSCKVHLQQNQLHNFFWLDLMSFGFSMTLVLFVVSCSMPRDVGVDSRQSAGITWLSLVVASALLAAAVA